MSDAMGFKQIEIDGMAITEKAQLEAFSTARLNQVYLEVSGIERSSKDKSAAVNRLWRFLNPRNERVQEDSDMASRTKTVKKMLPKGKKGNGVKEKEKEKEKGGKEKNVIFIQEKPMHKNSVRSVCYEIIKEHKRLTMQEYLVKCKEKGVDEAAAKSCLRLLSSTKQKTTSVKVA